MSDYEDDGYEFDWNNTPEHRPSYCNMPRWYRKTIEEQIMDLEQRALRGDVNAKMRLRLTKHWYHNEINRDIV